eukprot:3790374-Prymnesium_polylepis.1
MGGHRTCIGARPALTVHRTRGGRDRDCSLLHACAFGTPVAPGRTPCCSILWTLSVRHARGFPPRLSRDCA